ncbi:TonB-dependent receptor [Pontibacter sp. SGAir0037]|uniref:SusC/RagA family TonB-linked outer membrane protein n=1 Tax=Pontibacter sp. SGAir0037 TaxID=2571030 RepID=UPI0010CCC0C9|nr:TonB-dependent receptor [Pontibacter sp. SGAir0037]QCR22269.1 SusC/RagA family TonB-linked outer membrane protein [Pontibacter sp. SGAir0037]
MNQKLQSRNSGGSRRRCSLLLLAVLGFAPIEGYTLGHENAASGSMVAMNSPLDKSQDNTVTGVIRGTDGQPLPGVSVSVKGTSTGAITDVNGRFTINVAGVSDPVLVVSYIGFQRQEITIGSQSTFDISLQEDVKMMDEVVVVGYGTQKKANLTGAVSQVTSEVLVNRPITNLNSGLQGTMPGVTITGALGAPGNNAGNIRIRGIGTWGDASPLVVIDGVPGGNLNILNPDDIESISILKDAASSSIFGVRGANGVIMVTTKKGTTGKPSISFNTYFGLQTPTALPEFLGSPEYMELLNEAMVNAGRNPTYTDEDIAIARSGSDPNYFANTRWMDEIFKKHAPQQNHSLSINGGTDGMNYYISYAYLNEGGLVTGDNFSANRHNIRAKISTKIIDRIDVTANMGYVDRTYTSPANGTGSISAATSILPLVPVRNTAGSWGYIGGQSNPVALATDGGYNDFTSQEFTGNLNATLNLFKGFNLRGQYALFRSNSKRDIFNKTINYFSPEDGKLVYQTGNPNKFETRDYSNIKKGIIATAEYERRFADKHDVKLLLGVSQEQELSDNFEASRTHLPTQSVGHIRLGTDNQLNDGSATQSALRSLFGRANYGFNNKYLIEGNFRYDGSSQFISNLRWKLFAAGSVGWVFTEENFFAGLRDVVEFGKIRASYGTQGNDRIGNYAFMDILGPVQTMPIGNANRIGYRQTIVANEILTWESAIKSNIGIDLAFLRNRLNISADYFINQSDNLLLNLQNPAVFGAPDPIQNAGKMENRGWELQLNWNDRIGEVSYGANFNISDVRNKVVDLGNSNPTYGDRVRFIGQPLEAFYGLVAERIAQESDFRYDPESGEFVPDFPYIATDPVRPGDIIYKDLNEDGKVTLDEDRQVIGSHIPRYTYGFRGNIGWKGFDLNFFLQGVGKVNGYLTGSTRHAFMDQSTMPQPIHLDRWTPDNPNASYPRLSFQQTFNQRLSTFWLEDASYLRLKNVQIGYTLPSTISERLKINRLRVYASADNLLTITNFFYGYDPESPVGGANFYPQVKTFVFGLNINLK